MKKWLLFILLIIFVSPIHSFNLDSLLIKSLGGEKALSSLKNMKTYQSTGKITLNDQRGTFQQFYMPPDKFYLNIELQSYSITQAYDGQTAWQKGINGQITEVSGFEKKDMLKNLYFESISYLFKDRMPGSKEYKGIKNIDEVDYHEVAFYPFNSDTVVVYYDIQTGFRKIMLNKLDFITSKTYIDDHRLVDDILFPFYSRAEIEGISLATSFEVEHIQLNQPIDKNIFRMPDNKIFNYYFPESKEKVSIPFEYIKGHISISAIINGRKKVSFILDSGASANIFNSSSVKNLNLEIIGTIPSLGVGGFEDVTLVKIDSLQISDLTLYNLIAGNMDLELIAKSSTFENPFGGLLGYDFLSKFPVLIDYQLKTLTVYNPQTFSPSLEGVVIPFHLTMQIPTINAELNGYSGDFIVDLGNSMGLILHHGFVNKNNLLESLSDINENSTLIGGIGGALKGKNAFAASFKMGDIMIQSLRVLIPDSSQGISGSKALAGNIGNKILENFKLLFDYKNSRIILYKIES